MSSIYLGIEFGENFKGNKGEFNNKQIKTNYLHLKEFLKGCGDIQNWKFTKDTMEDNDIADTVLNVLIGQTKGLSSYYEREYVDEDIELIGTIDDFKLKTDFFNKDNSILFNPSGETEEDLKKSFEIGEKVKKVNDFLSEITYNELRNLQKEKNLKGKIPKEILERIENICKQYKTELEEELEEEFEEIKVEYSLSLAKLFSEYFEKITDIKKDISELEKLRETNKVKDNKVKTKKIQTR